MHLRRISRCAAPWLEQRPLGTRASKPATHARVVSKGRGGRDVGSSVLVSSRSTRISGSHLTSNKKRFPATLSEGIFRLQGTQVLENGFTPDGSGPGALDIFSAQLFSFRWPASNDSEAFDDAVATMVHSSLFSQSNDSQLIAYGDSSTAERAAI